MVEEREKGRRDERDGGRREEWERRVCWRRERNSIRKATPISLFTPSFFVGSSFFSPFFSSIFSPFFSPFCSSFSFSCFSSFFSSSFSSFFWRGIFSRKLKQ